MIIKKSEKDERREKIIDVAFRLFVNKKIESVTMGEIAKEAGIGRATLFRYFPGKLELVIAVNTKEWKEYFDELDQKIVQLLIKNARFSYSDIGKEVGISRVAVKARIQALEKKGVIEEYTTIINPQKISGAISCYFEIETLSNSFTDVIEILNQNNIVTQIYRVTGKNKLHVHAVAASNSEMEDFLHTTIDTLPGVISCSCNIILSRIKDIKGLRL